MFLEENTVFLDVGANIGTITQPIAAKWKSHNINIHSFEASEMIFKTLARNISFNKFKNVTLHNVAVADFNGELTFYEVTMIQK